MKRLTIPAQHDPRPEKYHCKLGIVAFALSVYASLMYIVSSTLKAIASLGKEQSIQLYGHTSVAVNKSDVICMSFIAVGIALALISFLRQDVKHHYSFWSVLINIALAIPLIAALLEKNKWTIF